MIDMPESPRLSVIVPVYNDPVGIRDTLDSLTEQRDPPRYEVVVVDNNSTDITPDVIKEFELAYPDTVFGCEEVDVQSSYAARNTGIKYSSGEILAFIDADVTVDSTWVTDVVSKFQDSSVDYLGCRVQMYVPDGEETIWARYDVAMGLPARYYLRSKNFAPTCALAIRREVVEEVGTFDEKIVSGGDKEFGTRVSDNGFKMEYAPEIVVTHPARTSLRSLVKKARRIGTGQVQLWERHNLAIHPLSPLRLLPPSPRRVKSRTQRNRTPLVTYLLSYLLKLVQSVKAAEVYWKKILRRPR